MKTLNEIKAEIAKEIHDTLASKGYDTTDNIELGDFYQFAQEVSVYDKYSDIVYTDYITVTALEPSEDYILIIGYDEEGKDVDYGMEDFTVEQMHDLYRIVCDFPDYGKTEE